MKQIQLKSQVKKDGEVILHFKPLKKGDNLIVIIQHDKSKSVLNLKDNKTSNLKAKNKRDSIFLLGKSPVLDSITDGSVNHDNYIYA